MLRLTFLLILIIQSITIVSQIDSTEVEVVEEFLIEEPLSFNNKILNYSYYDFLDSTRQQFDSVSAFKKLPWEIKRIYDFLKNKEDIIYTVEKLDLYKNTVKSVDEIGFKIYTDKKVIEAKTYDYSKNKYADSTDRSFILTPQKKIVELKPIKHPPMKLKRKSKDESLKFIPFASLGVFRTLKQKETIKINNQEYDCMIVEGVDTLLLENCKYWMVINKPGLIVKAIQESGDYRTTWLLKEIR